jgi:hypothetical protein
VLSITLMDYRVRANVWWIRESFQKYTKLITFMPPVDEEFNISTPAYNIYKMKWKPIYFHNKTKLTMAVPPPPQCNCAHTEMIPMRDVWKVTVKGENK